LNDQIVIQLRVRLAVGAEVGYFTVAHGIGIMQPEGVVAVKERNAKRGERAGLRFEFSHALYNLIMDEACKFEIEATDD